MRETRSKLVVIDKKRKAHGGISDNYICDCLHPVRNPLLVGRESRETDRRPQVQISRLWCRVEPGESNLLHRFVDQPSIGP